MKRLALLLALVAVFLCGCCFLPIPVYYTHGPGVSGKVLEAGTDRPIPGAMVVVRSGAGSDNCPDRTATTQPDGTFLVPADWDIHFGVWAATPSSGTCLPFALFQDGDGMMRFFYSVEIGADGYETGDWDSGPSFWDPNFPELSSPPSVPEPPKDGIYRLRPCANRPATPNPAEEPHAESAETAEPRPGEAGPLPEGAAERSDWQHFPHRSRKKVSKTVNVLPRNRV